MLSTPRNSAAHNQQAKLAVDYNELLKELSSNEMTSVGCYTIGETIGQGTYGKVKKGHHKLTGKVVAIKKISKQHAPMMAREIHHHKQIKHFNVVMLYEMITTESAIHIISEYCSNGDLLDALTLSGGRCSESRVHKWFQQLTDAINYCHLQHIVHRDLKLENILLDADDNAKICDFGFARYTQKNQFLETFCGSLSYSSPEIILRKKYTGPETDIWSLGVILYTLLAGEYPFDDDSEVITQKKIVQADYQMPYYFDSSLSDLIYHMLQIDPSHRLTMDAIMNHPWLTQIENTIDQGLTPSSSTSSNNSHSTIDSLPAQLKTFSPQVKASLGFTEKSPRFSAPALSIRQSESRTAYRSSLPSSFAQKNNGMTATEQRLFSALTAAGFDRDALVKMQTGECDTSSTLWHLLLENMTGQPLDNVSDAFALAVKNTRPNAVDCATQTSPVSSRRNSLVPPSDDTTALVNSAETKPYPRPVQHPTIQTVGFGSAIPERSGWFTSVKSWFGTKQQPQCGSNTQTSTSQSSMNATQLPTNMNDKDMIMSPPIYRTGSQKYRRKLLQLSEPPVSELDQLTYNSTSFTGTGSRQHTNMHTPRESSHFITSSVVMPPTALTSTRIVADTFSILGEAEELKEVDICEKRYSILHLIQQPTPPPSPPVAARSPLGVSSPAISPIEEKSLNLPPNESKLHIEPSGLPSTESSTRPIENRVTSPVTSFTTTPTRPPIPAVEPSPPFKARSSRFEFTPRSRLSAYSGQESRKPPMSSKTIIEEEEEEE